MKSSFYVLLSILGLGIIMFSCKDDETSNPVSVSPRMDIQLRVGSDNLTEGNTYTINGTKIQVDVARFYLGNIEFKGTNNFNQDDYYLISTNNSLALDNIDEGTYDLSFGIGVDSETNSQSTEDFTTRPTGDPLAAQEPSMHWNWNTGYKFLRVDAMVDTDGDDAVDTAVQYHLGSTPDFDFLAILDAPEQITITPESNQITIRFDLAGLLKDVEISEGASTHVGDNKPMADMIFANYTEAFSIVN